MKRSSSDSSSEIGRVAEQMWTMSTMSALRYHIGLQAEEKMEATTQACLRIRVRAACGVMRGRVEKREVDSKNHGAEVLDRGGSRPIHFLSPLSRQGTTDFLRARGRPGNVAAPASKETGKRNFTESHRAERICCMSVMPKKPLPAMRRFRTIHAF